MRIATVLRDLHRDEEELADTLIRLAEDHGADHEVRHLARDLSHWSTRHVREIAAIAPTFGEQLEPPPQSDRAVEEAVQESTARSALGNGQRSSETELVMVRALRDVYLRAASVLTDWEMVGQAAQAIVADDLLELATRCQGEAKRQMAWANAKIKEISTQALVS